MEEAREHPRQTLKLPVEFCASGGQRLAATCRDLSVGGMFVETPAPAAFASTVEIFVRLPALRGAETQIHATVRWTSPEGMGVQFGVMGAKETHALTEVLKARAV